MSTALWSAFQAMVEYSGATSGTTAGPLPPTNGSSPLLAWMGDNQTAIIIALAGFALFWLFRAAHTR